jgi:hypothetical protein
MATLSHRSTRALLAAVVAGLVAAFAAGSASAASGDVFFNGSGTCSPTTNAQLRMKSAPMTIYGLTTTNSVRVYYRLVNDRGSTQTPWYYLGGATATATSPAKVGSTELFRPQWNQWSRFEFQVQWYKPGTFGPVLVRWENRTLAYYAVYGIDYYNSSLSFQGYMTACYA